MRLPLHLLLGLPLKRKKSDYQPGPATLEEVIPPSELFGEEKEEEVEPLVELSWDINPLSKLEPFLIKQLFMVYGDGRLINHVTMTQEETADTEMVSSMLTAIQEYIGDSISDREEGDILENVKMGDFDLYLKAAKNIFVAAVVEGVVPEHFVDELASFAKELNLEYEHFLASWDGDVTQLEMTAIEMREFMEYWSKEIKLAG